jgi:hypothetical protein
LGGGISKGLLRGGRSERVLAGWIRDWLLDHVWVQRLHSGLDQVGGAVKMGALLGKFATGAAVVVGTA